MGKAFAKWTVPQTLPGQWLLLGVLLLWVCTLSGQTLPSLHMAALQGDTTVIREHIKNGSDLDTPDAYGSYPILVSTTFGHPRAAEMLIKAGADLTVADAYGSTALHLAAFFGRIDIARALIAAHADKYALTKNGATPYDMAASPFDRDKALYNDLLRQMAPLGLDLDLAMLELHRATIAELLRPTPEQLNSVDLTLPENTLWPSIEPIEAGIPSQLIAELFFDASYYANLYGIIILKRDHVVAEKYFNGYSPDQLSIIQSVTKSYFATLISIALDRGCIESLDERMIDFFPEYEEQLIGTPKADITIRHLLQMRSGYPWEELDPQIWHRFIDGVGQYSMIADCELVSTPGTEFNYSNLSSFILGIIAARACDVDLRSFALESLFDPIRSGYGEWYQDTLGNYYSLLSFTARDMARLGQLYLANGICNGRRILPIQWCEEALGQYSADAWIVDRSKQNIGRYLHDLNYGYQWWSADIAGYRVPFAWGHGGQMVYVIDEYDLVVVVLSDPQWRKHDSESWQAEQSVFNLIGKFLTLLFESNNPDH